MRVITSCGKPLPIRASSLARLFYTQAFDEDFDRVILGRLADGVDFSVVLGTLYQVMWAMNKAERFSRGEPTPVYGQWREELGAFDLSECIDGLVDEIAEGFTVKRTYKTEPDVGTGKRVPQKIMAIALKMGMSMRDLNELTTQAFIDIIHEYAGDKDEESRTPVWRLATPKEAAKFFTGRF